MSLWLLSFSGTCLALAHHPQNFLQDISGRKDEGQQISKHFCASCHDKNPIISLGAPRIGVVKDWKPRLKQGFKHLFRRASEGFGAMPPRGGCFECTDRQLLLAIEALLPQKLFLKNQ